MKRNITQENFDDVILLEQVKRSKSVKQTFLKSSLFLLISTLILGFSAFSAPISGTKSIGTGGDYATLTDAFADITLNTLGGNINLQLTGTYSADNEPSYPLNAPLQAAIGSNLVNIYPSTTGVFIYSTSSTGIINLNGTKNINIDGRVGFSGTTPDMKIYNLNSTTGYVINIANNSINNSVSYCKIQGGTNSYTIGMINFGAGTTGNNNNSITNCEISNFDPTGTPGPTPKIAIYSSNGTGTSSGNIINGNKIFNYFHATDSAQGVHVATGNTTWTITNNSFYQTASRTGTAATSVSHSGVLIKNTGNGYIITDNYFGGTAPLCGGTALTHSGGTVRYAAINLQQVGTATPTSVQNNTIRNINHTATATVNPVFVGVWVVLGSASIGTTTGNIIGSNTGNGSIIVTSGTAGAATNGILATSNGQIQVENNKIGSINIVAATTATTSTITAISMTPGGTVTPLGSWTCNNNVIGSTVTANSINISTASTTGTSTANGISTLLGTIPISVTGNTIANFNYNALTTGPVLRGMLLQGTAAIYTINSNTVFNLTVQNITTPAVSQNSTSSAIGMFINLQGSTTANNINDNVIYGIQNTNTTANSTRVVGMIVSSSVTPTVRRAKIYDITNASTGTSTTAPPLAVGFQVFGGGATLVNSMITLGLGQTTNTTFIGYWCNANGAGPYNMYYNTVDITGTAASGALPSFGFQRGGFVTSGGNTTVSATVDIKDNILHNGRTGGTGKHYAISNANLSGGAGWGVNASNYNILNSATSSTVGQWYNTVTVTLEDKTFASWKTISASDAASISGAVVSTYFTDATTGDLHINAGVNGTQIESSGSVVSGYTTDFDNQTRPFPSPVNGGTGIDIGADEFDGIVLDISVPTISYTPLNNTSLTGGETLPNFATITDNGNVNITIGTRPRLYYKRSTDTNVFNDNTNGTPGWKYDEANNTGPQFSFSIDYTRLQGGSVTIGNIIQYFVVAQDVNAPTPNVAINAGVFATTPTSVALTTANMPNPAGVNTYKITPALSGTVTVGTGGTYTSLTNVGGLFEAINNSALTGNLTANIISDITNESGTNTLLQAAEDGVGAGTYTIKIKPSGAARIVSGTPTIPQLIRLDGADRVTIDGSLSGGADRSLTISNLSGEYDNGNLTSMSVVAVLSASSSNGALNNTIKNCIIRGLSNVGTQIAIVQGGDVDGSGPLAQNNNNTYQNNLIFAAEYGVYMEGGANPEVGNIVAGNTIGSPFDALKTSFIGFFCEGESGLQITDNNILGVVGSANGDNIYGIFVNYKIPGLIMTGNNVTNIRNTNAGGGSIGIALGAFAGPNLNMLIANNTVSDVSSPGTNIATAPTFTNTNAGISVFNSGSGGASYKIYHNSVNMNTNLTTVNSMSAAFFSSTSGLGIIDLRNNSFANTQTTNNRYAIYLTTVTSGMFSTINRNDYYVVSGGNVGYVNSLAKSNLAAWQGATGQDAQSISADPKYNTATVLGPLTGSPLIGAGTGVGVLTDQIAIVRNVSNPSIGAYELAGDYAVPTITYNKLPFVCSGGNVSLVATIVDFSGVNITATLLPRIYFKKNNGSYFSAAGTQLTGSPQNGTWSFTINTTTLGTVTTGDVISYFVIAQDRAPNINVGTGPVGGFGSDVNTITALPIPDSFKISTALAPGTYTVGTAGTYTSLTAAMNAYNTSCLSGPVVFSLVDSKSYNTATGETFPINILANPYASVANTLTIKPAPGVTASVTGTGSRVLILKGTDYVTFDGSNTVSGTTRDLTIQSTSTTTGAIVYFMQSLGVGKGCSNNTIKNCIMQTGSKGTGANAGVTATLYTVYAGDVNGSAGADNDNFTLNNNQFKFSSLGVFGLSDVTGTLDNWTVTNNTFGDGSNYNASLARTGLSLSFANNLTVSGNTFTNIGVSDAGTATGINIGSTVTNVTIRKNVFVNINYTGSTANAYGGRAISINSGVPSSNIVIDNNSISNITGTSSNDSAEAIIGIRILGATDGVKLYYNSINLGSGNFSGAAGGIFSACVYVGPIVTNLDIRNNIFNTNLHNTNGAVSATARSYGLFSNAPSSAYTVINNNSYSFSNATVPLQGRLAAIGGVIRNTLADIIIGFGQNANSVSAIPVFTSATDLHLTAAGNCGLDNKAQQLTTYTTDFDGQTRASGINKPDIGFDEFTSSNTVWTGTVSTFWTNGANWCAGLVPDATIDVTIPAGTPFAPSLNGTANVKNMILSDGAAITLGTFTLNVAGSFSTPGTGTGAFVGGIYSQLNVAGVSTAKLNVTGANINNVSFASASGSTITLGTPVNVIGKLDIKGNTLITGTNLTMKSTPSGTANLAAVSVGGSVTGTVTVERYIPNNQKRAWRMLSVPVTGAQTFNAAWQEGQAPLVVGTPLLGTLLTKVGGGSGYDAASGNSLLSFTAGSPGSFSPVSSTANSMATTAGYFVYIRGDRSVGINPGIFSPGATTLRTKGSLYVGNQTVSLPAGNNVMVGNLFASAIDFTLLGGGKTSFKLWDPKAGADSVPGAYQTFAAITGYVPTPGGGSYIGVASNTRIESGAAFIVSGTGSIVLNETAKLDGSRNTFRSSEKIKQLKTNLIAISKSGDVLLDGNAVVFDNKYANDVDDVDVPKMDNMNENFGINTNGKHLVIEARSLIQNEDALQYNMNNIKNNKEYALEFHPCNLDAGTTAFLVDKFLGTTSEIDLSNTTRVKFNTTVMPASFATDRFKVIFKTNIKSVTIAEEELKVSTVSITPNPVTNGQVRIRIVDQQEGTYTVRFFNRTGQVIQSQVIKHIGNVSVNTLVLNSRLANGIYQVEVLKPNRERIIENVVISNTK